MKSFIYNGEKCKLFDAIKNNNIELSYNSFNMLLRKKDIKVNNVKVNSNITVNSGDGIILYLKNGEKIKSRKPDIIYEDDNIVIVNKPAGILSCGENSLESLLLKDFVNIYACHRLDRNTGGLIIFAKNLKSLNEIIKGFKSGWIEKFYYCKAFGYFEKESEKLMSYLFKDSKKSQVYIKDKQDTGYVKIETYYRVLKQYPDYAELEVKLICGKTHQIRAHLAYTGHPLIGDGKYGNEIINKEFKTHKQILISYKLNFKFDEKSFLCYLNKKEISLKV